MVLSYIAVLFPAHRTTQAIRVPRHRCALLRDQLDAIVLAGLVHKVQDAAVAVSVGALSAWD